MILYTIPSAYIFIMTICSYDNFLDVSRIEANVNYRNMNCSMSEFSIWNWCQVWIAIKINGSQHITVLLQIIAPDAIIEPIISMQIVYIYSLTIMSIIQGNAYHHHDLIAWLTNNHWHPLLLESQYFKSDSEVWLKRRL